MIKVLCDSCDQPMRFVEKLPLKKAMNSNNKYRVKKYFCDLCQIGKSVYAGGMRDEVLHPDRLIKQVKAIARQESKNREK